MAPLVLAVAVFVVMAPLGTLVIRWLLAHGIGKRIRTEGPETHQVKLGTATMGGLLFVIPAVLIGLILALMGYRLVWWPMLAAAAYGALGAFDDWQGLRDRQGGGWLARNKMPWQWGIGLALAAGIYLAGDAAPWRIPLSEGSVDLGWWFIPIGAVLLVGFANAVNLTDGLDGLAGGTSAIVLGVFGALAIGQGESGLALWTFGLLGGVLAFLWHNVHPARLFMGDVGCEALGGALAALALLTGHALLLVLAGIICVAEALSVMIQVSYFKYTRIRFGEGRRVFRMTPLHHHFELLGWHEVQVTQRFWLITGAAALLSLAVAGGAW
jgi:phospho-N-acetylmuramoyl-pentapeptide-transferase